MIIIWSYSILLSSFDLHFTIILSSSLNTSTIILWLLCDHDMITLQSSYVHSAIILFSFYNHLIIILGLYYDPLTISLCSHAHHFIIIIKLLKKFNNFTIILRSSYVYLSSGHIVIISLTTLKHIVIISLLSNINHSNSKNNKP